MSIMAKQGVCPHCGHDHRNPNKPMIPPVFKELADAEADIDILSSHNIELQQQLATTERLLAESQARWSIAIKFAQNTLASDELEDGTKEMSDALENLVFEAGELLSMPSDSTALDAAIAKAKREVLLEASNRAIEEQWLGAACVDGLRRMADELKGGEQG